MSRRRSVYRGLLITTTLFVFLLVLATIHIINYAETKAQVWRKNSLNGSPAVCSDGGYHGNWQTVVHEISFVYSAYLDAFSNGTTHTDIMLLGALKESQLRTSFRDELFCKLFVDEDTIFTTKLESLDEVMAEYYNGSRYTHLHYRCRFDPDIKLGPRSRISLLHTSHLGRVFTPTCLEIHGRPQDEPLFNFTLCVGGPVRGDGLSARRFVEWMEMARILGTERVFLYNMSMSGELDPYVTYYQDKALLEVFPWRKYPGVMDTGQVIPYFQKTLFADCLFRARLNSRFVLHYDLDEFVVPRHHDDLTWFDMIQRSDCGWDRPLYGARQLLYSQGYPDNQIHFTAGLLTQQVLYRNTEVVKYHMRSKNIANTRLVKDLTNHFGVVVIGKHCEMKLEVGGNHHYRTVPPGKRVNVEVIYDPVMMKYHSKLKHRLAKVFNDLWWLENQEMMFHELV